METLYIVLCVVLILVLIWWFATKESFVPPLTTQNVPAMVQEGSVVNGFNIPKVVLPLGVPFKRKVLVTLGEMPQDVEMAATVAQVKDALKNYNVTFETQKPGFEPPGVAPVKPPRVTLYTERDIMFTWGGGTSDPQGMINWIMRSIPFPVLTYA